MSNGANNQDKKAVDSTARAKALKNVIYDFLMGGAGGGVSANSISEQAFAEFLTKTGATKDTVDSFMTFTSDLLASMFEVISAFRHETTHTFDSTAVEVVNEFLGTSLDPSVMQTGKGGDETIAKANAIGKAILQRLEKEFTSTGPATPAAGEQGAATFAGYGVNFAIQNALISLLGACVPETRLDDLRELGVEVAQNLGLGRLMRVALRPLVQSTIGTPYQRQLYRRYQQELLPIGDLVKAWHAERMNQDDVFELMRQHGLRDEFLAELTEQTRHRLTAKEWDLLTAQGKQPEDDQALIETAEGMDSDWVAARLSLTTWDRLRPLRDRVLSELLPMVKDQFITIPQFQGALDRFQIPQDEQTLWRAAAAGFLEVSRKRPNLAEMLFLYEASQLTDDDIEQWLKAEGYYGQDVERMLTFFRLKFVAATEGKSANQAARAANLHAEHVAFVTDEITGIWGRPPTPAELNYWVTLLDSARRTKHDFTTELKALPTDGPAMP